MKKRGNLLIAVPHLEALALPETVGTAMTEAHANMNIPDGDPALARQAVVRTDSYACGFHHCSAPDCFDEICEISRCRELSA